jgi:hypothetical protein
MAAGVTRQMVWKWRRDPAYRAAFFRLFAAEYRRDHRKEAKTERDRLRQSPRSKRSADANLHVYITANWTGPIESPLDEQQLPS